MSDINGVAGGESSTNEIIQRLRAEEAEWEPYAFAGLFGQAANRLEALQQRVVFLENENKEFKWLAVNANIHAEGCDIWHTDHEYCGECTCPFDEWEKELGQADE